MNIKKKFNGRNVKSMESGSGETVQQLSVLNALSEGLGFFPQHQCGSSQRSIILVSRRSYALFWPREYQACLWFINIHAGKHSYP